MSTYKFKRPDREIDRVFLHCSATNIPSHDDVEVIRRWHKDQGWSDIGYHFFITSEGVLQVGRNLSIPPAAQRGHNTGTIAICLSGLNPEDFNESQFKTLVELCEDINDQIPNLTFHGHCEVSDKLCPVFDYRKVLNLDKFGVISMDVDLATRVSELEKRVAALEK